MEKVKINDIAEVISGLSYRRYLDNNGDEFKVVVQRSIKKDGELSDFEELKLTPDKLKKRYFTQNNDILMKMSYPFDVVCVNQENIVVGDRIAIIRLKEGYNPSFISHLLTNVHIKKQLHKLGSNDRIPHASLKEIKELELNIPNLKTQTKYGELLDLINEKIKVDYGIIDYDRNLKEAILNNLLEGEFNDKQ